MIECVPNLSEGRDSGSVLRIADAVRRAGARVLDVHIDADHNRSVLTIVGESCVVVAGVISMMKAAIESIDMRTHSGVHPRMGAVDVIPFVPLHEATLDECVAVARKAGLRIAEDLAVPVYFYEAAATRPDRKNLAAVRRGGLTGVAERAKTERGRPDLGPTHLDPRTGAVAVGARRFLAAYNVNLATADVAVAREIASVIRASAGGLPGVKALGLPLRSRGIVQVSMNLTDVEATTLADAFARVSEESTRRGVNVLESEIVGLVPKKALGGAAAEDLLLPCELSDITLEDRLEAG